MGTRARIAVAAAIGVAACRQLVGIGDEPPGAGSVAVDASVDGAPACGGFAWTGGTCAACMQGACCQEQQDCRADAICASNFDCIAKCPGDDDVCRSRCISLPDAVMAPLASCQARSCEPECGLRCGGIYGLQPGLDPDAATAACVSCLYGGASCAATREYAQNTGCLTQQFCVEDCNLLDDVCFDDCIASDAAQSCNLGDGGLGQALNSCNPVCTMGGPDWSCVGHVTWPAAMVPTVTYELQVTSQDGGPLRGVSGRACAQTDPQCSNQVATAVTDGGGDLVFTMGNNFRGYLDLEPPADAGYIPELLFHYPPLAESLNPTWPNGLGLLTVGLLMNLESAVMVPYEPSLGIIYAEPFDCVGKAAPGVSFTGTMSQLGAAAKPYYFVDGVPNGQALATQATSTVGGGFVNVMPGLVTIEAHAGGKVVATVSVDVRKNAITYLQHLVPTP